MLRAVLRFIYFACDSAFAGSDHNAFVLLCLPTAVFIWVDVGPILLHGKFTLFIDFVVTFASNLQRWHSHLEATQTAVTRD